MNINLDGKIDNNQPKAEISAININSQNQNLKSNDKKQIKILKYKLGINTFLSILLIALFFVIPFTYSEKWKVFFFMTLWSFAMNAFYVVSVTIIDWIRYKKSSEMVCLKYNDFIRNKYLKICFPFSISIVFLYWMLILLGDDFEYRGREASDTAVGLFFHGIILIFLFFDVFTAKHKHLKNYFWDILILNIFIAAYFLLLGIGKYIIEYEPYDFMEMASVRQIVGACVLIYISIMDGYVIINLLANQFFDNDINDSKLKSNFINNYGEIVPIKGNIIEKYDMTNEKRDINLFNNSIKANNEVNAEIDNNTWESIN